MTIRRSPQAWWSAVAIIGLLLADTASAQDSADFRTVQKWAVSYSDLAMGWVEGVAYCDWQKRHCRLQDLLPTSALGATFTDRAVDLPFTPDGTIVIRLGPELTGAGPHGPWPSKQEGSRVTPEHRIGGGDGGSGKITIKNGDTEVATGAPVRATAVADYDTVSFLLQQGSDGSLGGEWRYLADPVTQRHGDGSGPVGIVDMVRDDDPAITGVDNRPGGLRAVAHGGAAWRPLPPRIFAVHVLEDQAAFENGVPKYTHARLGEQTRAPVPGAASDVPQTTAALPQKNLRTLVIFGEDLPLAFWDKDKSITPVGESTDTLRYEILGVSYGGQDKGETRFERARRSLIDRARRQYKPGMTASEEYAFRHLDAALVRVWITDADPGEKQLAWGEARGKWNLQYGDNTAELRFIRMLNATQSEPVPEIALPEQVVVEVEVGSSIADDQLPIMVNFGARLVEPVKLMATRSSDHPTIYRTPPILFVDEADQARAAGVSGPRLAPAKGNRVTASLDRDKTKFLRASVAEAVVGKPSALWLAALQDAAKCGSTTLNAADWPSLARRPAETVSWTGGLVSGRNDVSITYGDHAAMIILRNSFVQVMKSQLAELDTVKGDDQLVDAWYRSMQPAVTQIPDYPLATFTVASPTGQVPFARAYADDFAEGTFQRGSTADGEQRYRAWRLEASRAALGFLREKMVAAMAEADAIATCNRRDLLRLTGSGFRHVASRITPLLMKFRTPAQEGYRADRDLAEPDALARGYVNNLDTLAAAVGAVKDLSMLTNTAVVAAAVVLVAPAAGVVWNEGIGALAGVVGGLAVYSYDTAWQLQQTRREHIEVELGFGSVPALGFERYFDAAARSTPWWKTGALIFANTALQIAAIRSASKPIAEGLSEWRGAAIAEKLDQSNGWDTLKQFSIEEQRDVALFLFKEEERAAQTAIFGQIRTLAHRVFVRLGRQAAGESAPAANEAVTALDQEALAEAQGLPTEKPPADKLRPLKNGSAQADLAVRGRSQIGAGALAEAEQDGKAAVAMEAAGAEVRQAWRVYTDAPLPKDAAGALFKAKINGNWVSFEIEKFLGDGAFFQVYKLKTPPRGINLQRLGDNLVLKILRKDIEAFTTIPEVRTGVIQRMVKARELLRKAGIPQVDFQEFEDAGIVLQQEVKFEPGKIEKWAADADKAKRVAVVQLYKDLSDKGLVWLDGHRDNLYFEKAGEGWVAKILDQDFITDFAGVKDGIFPKWLDYLRNPPGGSAVGKSEAIGLLHTDTSARDLMVAMLEYKRWIDFSMYQKRFVPKLLQPEDIWEVFKDLPFEKPLPKQGSIVPFPMQPHYARSETPILHAARVRPLAA